MPTFAPEALLDLQTYLAGQPGLSKGKLGIVGDADHVAAGYSYHLGKSQLNPGAYSAKTARDKAGLSDAASAMDIGNHKDLRGLSEWLVDQCRVNAPGTSDIREVIYSDDGVRVLRWDRERGYKSEPREGEADDTHLWHTHLSTYRDSEFRDKTVMFRPYYEEKAVRSFNLIDGPAADVVVKDTGASYLRLKDGSINDAAVGMARKACLPVRLLDPIIKGKPRTDDWMLGRLIGTEAAFLLERNLTLTPVPAPVDCAPLVAAAIAKTKASAKIKDPAIVFGP